MAKADPTSCCAPARTGEDKTTTSPDGAIDLPTAAPISSPNSGAAIMPPPQYVAIPGGKGLLGTDDPQIALDEEGPLRTSRINPFWIEASTVTNARFAAFVAATNYVTDAERLGDSFVFAGLLPADANEDKAVMAAQWWRMVSGACWHRPLGPYQTGPIADDHPVTHVTWNDAQAFAGWVGGRLPTEAEWEHAARGGRGDVTFPWGDTAPNDHDFFPCNIWQGTFPSHNSLGDGFYGTAPVDAFPPNAYGLFNMVGNVWEWTAQNFKVRSLKRHIKQAHANKQGFKVIKGGSFLCHASYCYRYRIAARTANSPDSSTSHTGFRICYDKPPTPAS